MLAALLALGCGAQRAPAPLRTLPAPPLPHAAITAQATPRAVEQALARLDDRLGASVDALGPVGVAWQRTRHGLDDLWAALDGPQAAPSPGRWGLDPAQPVTIWWGAADGGALAQAFVRRLQGAPAEPVQAAIWQLRLAATVVDPRALVGTLERVVGRLGWTEEPTSWPLPGVAWHQAGPDGLWLGIRLHGREVIVDLVRTVGPATQAVVAGALARGGGPPFEPGDGAMTLTVSAAGLGALEAAQAAAVGLTFPDPRSRAAVAEVLTTCVDAWSRLAGLAPATRHDLQVSSAGLRWQVTAHLTPMGEAAWGGAQRALPLGPRGPEPAGYQVALAGAHFADPGLPVLDRCPATHAWMRALALPPAAPALLALAPPPQPGPPTGWGEGEPSGYAALVLGAGDGGVPHLGAVQVGVRLPDAPLGPRADAVADPRGQRWVLGMDGLAVSAARRTLAQTPVAVFGIGPDAALRVAERLDATGVEPALFAEAWLRPGPLADALVGAGLAGPEVQALRAVAARLGPLRVEGRRVGATLAIEARWGELDHPPGGQ